MNTNTFFNIRRFYVLSRNTILLNSVPLLIIAGAFGGISLFLSGVNAFVDPRLDIHKKLYLALLFSGGFVVTGRIFRELHHKERGSAWLVLPASMFEKFSSRLFLSTIGYIVGTVIFWFLFSVVSEGLNWIIFRQTNSLFNPFDQRILWAMAYYIVLQSPLLVGAVYFKRLTISKTILILVIFLLLVLLVALLAVKIIFWNHFEGIVPSFEFISGLVELAGGFGGQFVEIFRVICWILRVIFWAVIAPLCWLIGYYRLKETEV